jgi:tetraacyldisaccharide 4'-kinase
LSDTADTWRRTISGERRGLWPALVRCGLWWTRLPYGIGVRWRNWLYNKGWKETHRAGVPVVSVGNLSVGGTGKTPCVEYIARFYREHDLRVAILSRGYGSETGRNDEAMVLEENLPDVPHFQGADRVEMARIAGEEAEPDVLVLDDGFQHRRLARDLDIVLIDATDPCGNRYLFPRGTLREPFGSLLRAHVAMLTHCDAVEPRALEVLRNRVEYYLGAGVIVTSRHEPFGLVGAEGRVASLGTLKQQPVAAFCGIGNPEAFRRTLRDAGANVVDFRTFPDHHNYTRDDVDDLRNWAARQPDDALIATTQKDLVKLRIADLSGRPLWAVRVGLGFLEGQEEFNRLLLDVVPEHHRTPEQPRSS